MLRSQTQPAVTAAVKRKRSASIDAILIAGVNPRVDGEINSRFNPCADDRAPARIHDRGMTISDYLINSVFVFVVLRQARERRLDARSLLIPLLIVVFVARQYVHSIPTAGNDLVLVALLAAVGLTLGVLCGFATRVRAGGDGVALARVGWLAGGLLIAGICSRMVFVFALNHGAEPAVRAFSVAHHIGAAAWPVALVSMALCEVTARLLIVQLRGRRLTAAHRAAPIAAGAHA